MKNSKQGDSPQKAGTVKGWILDLYSCRANEMVVWIKSETGSCVRLVDKWSPFFYVSAPSHTDLIRLIRYLPQKDFKIKYEFVDKFVNLLDHKRTMVLRLIVSNMVNLRSLATFIWSLGDYGRYRLWNVDIPLSQMYLCDKNLFPLAFVEASIKDEEVIWKLLDRAEDVEYPVPPLRIAKLTVEIDAMGIAPCFSDKITAIRLKFSNELVEIDSKDEGKIIERLVEVVQNKDPDIILTYGGDSFLFTYLARRALRHDLLPRLALGRDEARLRVFNMKGGTYFSYGRVYYRDATQQLLGRIHIDVKNSGTYALYGLEGLIEVARTCRIPLERASRVSIGSCMTAIQLYQAIKDDRLVPWKKNEAEQFKTATNLLVADRGGFYFEPKVGIHNNVGEIDFNSMYPMLMLKKNISPETIGCECCPDSKKRVPELNYSICEKRVGIVPKVLDLMLKKRIYYKAMKKKANTPNAILKYEQRQAAYKIILCTCFGYLGYRNARFGKVDAHIAVCAFARKTLWDTLRLAEQRGFEIVHGIVDSLYLKKESVTNRDFVDLCKEITKQTDLPINYEGKYRWIVFLPSKIHCGVPVLNRFYGVFQDGKIKARGIELRRGDTPNIIAQCQEEVIQELAKAKNSEEFIQHIPNALSVLRKYTRWILDRTVDPDDLVIDKQLSKTPDSYVSNLHHVIAAKQLQNHDIKVFAGQTVSYVIVDAENKRPERRVMAAQLLDQSSRYDTKKYVRLLNDAISTILAPFVSKKITHNNTQTKTLIETDLRAFTK